MSNLPNESQPTGDKNQARWNDKGGNLPTMKNTKASVETEIIGTKRMRVLNCNCSSGGMLWTRANQDDTTAMVLRRLTSLGEDLTAMEEIA